MYHCWRRICLETLGWLFQFTIANGQDFVTKDGIRMIRFLRLYRLAALSLVLSLLGSLAGCAPEVGSKAWCEDMSAKPKGDWSTNEALDFSRNCLFRNDD